MTTKQETRTYWMPGWFLMGTPPVEQGQIVSSSYGVDLEYGIALRHTVDASDRAESWAITDLSDDEVDALGDEWNASNGRPVDGPESRWHPVEVVQDDD